MCSVGEWHSVHPFYWVRSVVKPPPHPHPSPHICVCGVCVCVYVKSLSSPLWRGNRCFPSPKGLMRRGRGANGFPPPKSMQQPAKGSMRLIQPSSSPPSRVQTPIHLTFRVDNTPPPLTRSSSSSKSLTTQNYNLKFFQFRFLLPLITQALTGPKSHTDTRCGTGLRRDRPHARRPSTRKARD